jgi:hypothetical protein
MTLQLVQTPQPLFFIRFPHISPYLIFTYFLPIWGVSQVYVSLSLAHCHWSYWECVVLSTACVLVRPTHISQRHQAPKSMLDCVGSTFLWASVL